MAKKIQDKFTIQVPTGLAKDIDSYIRNYNYSGPAELFRDSIREKIYGKTRKNEIINSQNKQNLDEDKYFFEENKNLFERLKKIEKNL